MRALTLAILACATLFLMGAKSPIVRMQGKVISFSENTVILENNKKKVEVPRAFIGAKKLKVGETVEAAYNEKEQSKVKVRKESK